MSRPCTTPSDVYVVEHLLLQDRVVVAIVERACAAEQVDVLLAFSSNNSEPLALLNITGNERM